MAGSPEPGLGEDRFVNPYTFVPFPSEPLDRHPPAGHERLSALPEPRYLGRLELVIEARTRLLIRQQAQESRAERQAGLPTRRGVPILPGSSLHGALRSMHETLVGGCLRVFDDGFIPSYRDAVVAGINSGWQLAVVDDVDENGRPTTLTLCRTTAGVKSETLQEALGVSELRTGLRLRIAGEPHEKNGRSVFKEAGAISEDVKGEWVVLLSDGRARQPLKRPRPGVDRDYIPYWCTVGRRSGGREYAGIPDHVWQQFQDVARDARDFTVAVRGTTESALRRREVQQARERLEVLRTNRQSPWVTWPEEADEQRVVVGNAPRERAIGVRAPHRPWLFPGLPVWVRTAPNDVTGRDEIQGLKLSVAWRHVGGTATARDRVPPSVLPCRDPDHLCPTCRVFGAADTTAREDDDAARQSSYRGHVRVGDAVPVEPVAPEQLHLAPMGRPRPGAGQFYLITPPGHREPANDDAAALREWGSLGDSPRPRPLRGRKFYWRTGGRIKDPLWQAKRHHSDTMTTTSEAFPAGTRLAATIFFDGLTLAEIGAIVSCLQPSVVLADEGASDAVFTVGGGKPFGFGACDVHVQLQDLQTARSRWDEESQPDLAIDDAVEAFRVSQPVARPTWPALARAVQMEAIDGTRVWYPPGASWNRVGSEEFDKGYEFWRTTVGHNTKPPKHLVQLPDITADRQDLRIVVKGDRRGR